MLRREKPGALHSGHVRAHRRSRRTSRGPTRCCPTWGTGANGDRSDRRHLLWRARRDCPWPITGSPLSTAQRSIPVNRPTATRQLSSGPRLATSPTSELCRRISSSVTWWPRGKFSPWTRAATQTPTCFAWKMRYRARSLTTRPDRSDDSTGTCQAVSRVPPQERTNVPPRSSPPPMEPSQPRAPSARITDEAQSHPSSFDRQQSRRERW